MAILKDGRVLAEGPPDSLGASRYRVAWRDASGSIVERFTDDPTALLASLTAAALERGERLEELSVRGRRSRTWYLELDGGPGGMSGVVWYGAVWRQYRLERRMFWRTPSAAFFGVLLPLLLLAIFGAVSVAPRRTST